MELSCGTLNFTSWKAGVPWGTTWETLAQQFKHPRHAVGYTGAGSSDSPPLFRARDYIQTFLIINLLSHKTAIAASVKYNDKSRGLRQDLKEAKLGNTLNLGRLN